MTQLLVIREYIKNFYTKYEEFIVPLLKFVLGLILFLTINGRMGYMEKIDHVAIVLVAALLCSFLPLGVMVFLSAMFLLLHTYALSAVCTESAFAAAFDTASVCVEDPLCGSVGSGTVRDTGSCGCGCRRRSGILCAGIYYR